MPRQVVILGAGAIGAALFSVLRSRSHCELWDIEASKVPNQKPLEKIIPGAEVVFLCIPSWTTRQALRELRPHLSRTAISISLAKGLEEDTGKSVAQMIPEELPSQRFGLLGGAMLAKEIALGMSSVGVIGSQDRAVFNAAHSLFQNTHVYLWYSPEVLGVALASVLKNIYAVAFGIADGLGWSHNVKGWLTVQAVEEMLSIGGLLGVRPKTILGPAGLGDLVATGFSPYSNNRAMGEELIKTGTYRVKREGLVSLPSLLKLVNAEKFPLLSTLSKIVMQHTQAASLFKQLLSSPEYSRSVGWGRGSLSKK